MYHTVCCCIQPPRSTCAGVHKVFLAACSQEPEWVPGQTVLYVVVYNPLEVPAQVSTRCSLQPAPRNLSGSQARLFYMLLYTTPLKYLHRCLQNLWRCSLQPAPRNLSSVPGQTVLYVVVYNPLEVPTQVSTSQRLKVSKGHSKNKTQVSSQVSGWYKNLCRYFVHEMSSFLPVFGLTLQLVDLRCYGWRCHYICGSIEGMPYL